MLLCEIILKINPSNIKTRSTIMQLKQPYLTRYKMKKMFGCTVMLGNTGKILYARKISPTKIIFIISLMV